MQMTPHPQLSDSSWALGQVSVPQGSQIRGRVVWGL